MRPLIARRGPEVTRRAPDPAPSRWRYRAQRMWLTPIFRSLFRVWLPAGVLLYLAVVHVVQNDYLSDAIETAQSVRREIEDRPEFRVNLLAIEGASAAVTEDVRAALAIDLPISSFDLDLEALREVVEELPAVAQAELRIEAGGVLAVNLREREPAVIWQTSKGQALVDSDGVFVAWLSERTLERPLPVVAGFWADAAVSDALAIHAAALPLAARLEGLVRVGQRRWDVVLDGGPRILLPETGARAALDRVLALDDVQDILSRDILRVDLRNPQRPTVQLSEEALASLRAMRAADP